MAPTLSLQLSGDKSGDSAGPHTLTSGDGQAGVQLETLGGPSSKLAPVSSCPRDVSTDPVPSVL